MSEIDDRLDRLESLVEQQQETIEAQQAALDRRAEQLDQLRAANESADDGPTADGTTDTERSSTGATVPASDPASDTDPDGADTEAGDDLPGSAATRRAVLTSGGVLGMFGLGVGSASADSQGQVGTSSDELNALYTAELNGGVTGDTPLTSLVGTGLQIASGSLDLDQSITPTWTDTHTWDTGGNANLTVDETGFAYSTADAETLNVQNTGDGSVTVQEDGTPVVTESRSLAGGKAIRPIGDLSDDRTVDVDAAALAGEGLTDNSGSLDIDSDIRVSSLIDSNGNDHLTLTNGGPLDLNQPLDTNGNNIQSNGSVSVDIDANDDGIEETFSVTANGGTTDLLTVNDDGAGGKVTIPNGNLSIEGDGTPFDIINVFGNVSFRTNNNGDLTLDPGVDNDIEFSSLAESGSGNTLKIDGTTVYEGTSSARYKTDICPMEPGSERVLDLEPRSFEYTETGDEDIGLIAEDVEETLPSLVTYDEEDQPNGVRYDRLGVFLIPEVDENCDRIGDLEAELDAKDARIDDQQDRIDRLESKVGRKADRIDDLEAENADLRDRNAELETRLERVEAELGIDATTDRQGVADD